MFLSWKNPGKRGVGHRRRHLGRARKSVRGRVTKRGGEQLKERAVEGEGFVTRPRPIFARVQDGAGDGELRVFWGLSAIKTPPSNRLQAG